MSKIKKNQSGFTLVETVVTITIGVLIILALAGSYFLSQEIYLENSNKTEIIQNGRVILDQLTREIRQTREIITELPETTDDPESLPEEILFQNGHNATEISYIRYYLDGSDIRRQEIIYYFESNPDEYVYQYASDQEGNPPIMEVLEDQLIGEYLSDLEFWGNSLININIYLAKKGQTQIINTAICGRNL